MSMQTVKDSPRCTICGDLTIDKLQHFKNNHLQLYLYHLNQQTLDVIRGLKPFIIFDDGVQYKACRSCKEPLENAW